MIAWEILRYGSMGSIERDALASGENAVGGEAEVVCLRHQPLCNKI